MDIQDFTMGKKIFIKRKLTLSILYNNLVTKNPKFLTFALNYQEDPLAHIGFLCYYHPSLFGLCPSF